MCGKRGYCVVAEAPTWNVTFAVPKPPVRVPPTPVPTSRRKYLLHYTDPHYVRRATVHARACVPFGLHPGPKRLTLRSRPRQDPKYTAGLEADCGEPMCCRPPNLVATRRAAGPFGDFNCDAPRALLVDLLDFVANRGDLPAIDYVLWTGDIPPHDVWESTRENYVDLMNDQAELLANYVPNAVVLGAIGYVQRRARAVTPPGTRRPRSPCARHGTL